MKEQPNASTLLNTNNSHNIYVVSFQILKQQQSAKKDLSRK